MLVHETFCVRMLFLIFQDVIYITSFYVSATIIPDTWGYDSLGSGASGSSDHTLVASSRDAKLLHCFLTSREPSSNKNKVRDTRGCLSSAACENPDRMIISDQPLCGIIEYVQRLYRTTYAKQFMQGYVWNLCTKCAASKNGDPVCQ